MAARGSPLQKNENPIKISIHHKGLETHSPSMKPDFSPCALCAFVMNYAKLGFLRIES